MTKKNYEELAEEIVKFVGGKANISNFAHCITRLRFNLKDKGLVQSEKIDALAGVIGSQWSGDQFQIIIGQDVQKVYDIICHNSGLKPEVAINEELEEDVNRNKKFSFKTIGDKVLGYLSPIMIGILPIMIGASMCKMIGVLLGPGVLNVISETSDLYLLFNMLYNAFFYFLPIYLGYLAAKTLKIDITLGIFMGAMIIVPDFVALVGIRETFPVFGIEVPVANYGQTFLPVILGVWIMSFVYKLFKKIIPQFLSTVFVPTFTILVMAIVMFAICAPLGSYVGELVGNFFIMIADSGGVISLIGYIILGALFPYIVLGGMHMVLINFAIMTFLANGFESFVLPLGFGYSFAIYGVAFGAMLKMKKKENRATTLSYVVTGLLAGISEPILYGVVLKYKSAMKALFVACVIAGAYCGIFRPAQYIAGSTCNVFSAFTSWVGGGTANIAYGLILVVLSFVVGTAASYFMIKVGED